MQDFLKMNAPLSYIAFYIPVYSWEILDLPLMRNWSFSSIIWKFRQCIKKSEKTGNRLRMHWRIQNFPEGGAPTPKVGMQTYYLRQFLPGNCMKLKLNGPKGGAHPYSCLRHGMSQKQPRCLHYRLHWPFRPISVISVQFLHFHAVFGENLPKI